MSNKVLESYVTPRYYLNLYILKEDYAILRMVRRHDNFTVDSIIDLEDVERCRHYAWYPHHDPNKPEHLTYIKCGDKIRLHRFIANLEDKSLIIDHIDRNPLNNRKSNLKICTVNENNKNLSKYRNNTSGYNGVRYCNNKKRFIAQRMINYKLISKSFRTLKEAIEYRKYLETL